MADQAVYSLSDIAREAGKEGNRKMVRLIADRAPTVPYRVFGPSRMYDEKGKAEILRRIDEWDNRPRLRQPAAATV